MIDLHFCLKCRSYQVSATHWWHMYLSMNPHDRSTCLACQCRKVDDE